MALLSGAGVPPKRPTTPDEKLDDALDRIVGMSLGASIGRWSGRAETVIVDVPSEVIVSYKESIYPKPTPAHLLALPQLKVNNHGEKEELPIVFGYKEKKGDVVKLVVDSDGVEILYELKEDTAFWSGGLRGMFREKLSKAASGDTVTYRNKAFVKLDEVEMQELAKKEYDAGIAFI